MGGPGGAGAPLPDDFVAQGVVAVNGGGQLTEDLAGSDEAAIRRRVRDAGLAPIYTRMLDDFVNEIAPGDAVLMPGRGEQLHVGIVRGAYRHVPEPVVAGYVHTREIEWVGTLRRDDLPDRDVLRIRRTLFELPAGTIPSRFVADHGTTGS